MRRNFASLYVHVPFCRGKCDYCAFYSLPASTPVLRQSWRQRLDSEFAEFADRCAELQTVYVGGGTPSSLGRAELASLMASVRRRFRFAPNLEWTVEANPDSLTPTAVRVLADAGVTRISLGIQSFQPRLRRQLGRHGTLARLPDLLAALRAAGIADLSMDLIYAIPDQTMAAWENDLRRALDCGIVHVSTYALTSEEGTALARRGAKPVDDALSTDMWELAETVAAQYGLARYEVSNLARPGHACRHNLDIWHGATYLGCGPAAASFDGELRWTNPPDLKRWLDSAAPREEDALPAPARAAELLAFGLRTVSGWERASFGDCTGFDYLELRGDILRSLAAEGLLVLTPERVCPTRLGLLFADHVARELL